MISLLMASCQLLRDSFLPAASIAAGKKSSARDHDDTNYVECIDRKQKETLNQ